MLCRKNLIIGFGIFLPVLLSVLFVSPSYAVSDYSYTFDLSNIPSWYDFCNDSGSVHCSDYSYVHFDTSSAVCTRSSYFYVSGFSASGNVPVSPCIDSYYPLSSITALFLTGGKSGSPTGDITIILTNSIGTPCPEPEEPEPCPVVPENPYDDKLDNITRAIYVCGAILIVLYFFYCIYRMIIKNSGVNNL